MLISFAKFSHDFTIIVARKHIQETWFYYTTLFFALGCALQN